VAVELTNLVILLLVVQVAVVLVGHFLVVTMLLLVLQILVQVAVVQVDNIMFVVYLVKQVVQALLSFVINFNKVII
jgi:hypothetical protein